MVKTWDISGMGGHYEETCQKLFWTGVKYLQEIHDPKTFFKGMNSFKNIVGILITPERMKELEEQMSKAVDGDWTGAQHETVIGHLRFIAENGYQKWFAELEEVRKPEQCYDFDLDSMGLST